MFRPEQVLAKAWACVGVGDRKLGVILLGDAADIAVGQGQQLVEVRAHHAGVRLGDPGAARRLLRVAPAVEGSFAQSAARHARAFLDGDAAALSRAGRHFEQDGALAEAADAIAQASRAARRSGDAAATRKLAGRATSIAESVGGLDTPALRSVASERPLTRRQRDVARLAASGLSSREIADRLGVGVRTVESHLATTYRLLGVSSRAELATVLPVGPGRGL